MADLIDRKKLREEIESDFYWGNPINCLDRIDAAPAVDAVEVVRCKDCIHARELRDEGWEKAYSDIPGCRYCEYKDIGVLLEEYCSDGERREESEDG